MANTNQRFNRDEINDELQKLGVVTREISPSPQFLTTLESSGYKVPEALSDITDNCIDAGATKIITYFGKENKKPYIVIGDNGIGMDPDILFGALVLGASTAELGNKVKNGGSLGKYGTGLKSSLAELRGVALILTKTKDGQLIKTIYHKDTIQEYYDSIDPKTGKLRHAWGISIEFATDKEDVELFEKYTNGSKQGTVIKIYNIERFKDDVSIKNTMKKTYSRHFHRFITNGVEFVVNDVILTPVDLSGYEIPFTLNGETYRSKLIGVDQIWDNITYTDKHGVKHKDGRLLYRALSLPQMNELDEDAWNKEFGWNIPQQGILVYRGHRLIQSTGWFGLWQQVDRLKRFRVVLEFNGDLDELMNVDYKKTSVDPGPEILKIIQDCLRRDIATATSIFYNSNPKKNQISKSLKKLAKSFGDWAKNNINLLPKIPPATTTTRLPKSSCKKCNKKPCICQHPPKPPRQIGDRLKLIFTNQITDGSFYQTETSGRYNNCLNIYFNTNHVMVTDFVEKADTYTLSPIVCMIWAEHFGIEMNKPDTPKELSKYYDRWNRIQMDKGSWLTKMYPTTPKV